MMIGFGVRSSRAFGPELMASTTGWPYTGMDGNSGYLALVLLSFAEVQCSTI